jgi:hypothetical protein
MSKTNKQTKKIKIQSFNNGLTNGLTFSGKGRNGKK